jgi:hypothetical protein
MFRGLLMFIIGGFSVALLFKNPSLAKGLRDFTLNTIKSKTNIDKVVDE